MVEGTPLLREHTGLNLYQGFDSLRLRQKIDKPLIFKGFFIGLRIFSYQDVNIQGAANADRTSREIRD